MAQATVGAACAAVPTQLGPHSTLPGELLSWNPPVAPCSPAAATQQVSEPPPRPTTSPPHLGPAALRPSSPGSCASSAMTWAPASASPR